MTGRSTFILVSALISAFLAYIDFGEAFLFNNDGLEIVGLVFAVMAGALMTAMSVIIGTNQITHPDWRKTWNKGKSIRQDLVFLSILFYLYIFTLGLITIIVSDIYKALPPFLFISTPILLGFSVPFAFFLSFMIPGLMLGFKTKKLNEDIERRRQR